MLNIRQNTFETNSSSAHSLVVTAGADSYYTHDEALEEIKYFMNEDGIYAPWHDMYFGRYPFMILYRFEEKLRYAYANAPIRKGRIKRNGYPGYWSEYYKITNKVKKFIPELKGFSKAETDAIGTDDNLLFKWLKEMDISLIEFLTNKKIIVICDGDEYCVWSKMKNNGLIDKNHIKLELPERQWFDD